MTNNLDTLATALRARLRASGAQHGGGAGCGQQDEDEDEGEGEGEDEGEGGQQPAGPAHPEVAQVDAAAAAVFGQQQVGDQVAAEDEEDVDAEETAGQPGRVDVVEDHGGEALSGTDTEGATPASRVPSADAQPAASTIPADASPARAAVRTGTGTGTDHRRPKRSMRNPAIRAFAAIRNACV
ncbi:hypothetical protein AOB60_28855 [Streptomyces noursei]|uniref:Uncharacterized protein n=1 Tax=Streptomyces noursei TaxID=1971 RepID=A0A2N8PAU5_STRNR|nr:hypothetical protein AOB60_28855 [Streptomyces noursei]